MPGMGFVTLRLGVGSALYCALKIPLTKVPHFAPTNPATWLAYLGFALAGTPGVLCDAKDEAIDLTDPSSIDLSCSVTLTYRLDDPAKYAPIDPAATLDGPSVVESDDISDDGSYISEGQAEFEDRLIERDETCVISRIPADLCEGVHVVPKSLGDQWIEGLSTRRGQPFGESVITDIYDQRNGLLANSIFRKMFGKDLAILPVPNPHMLAADAPKTGTAGYYVHVFREDLPAAAAALTPHNGCLHSSNPKQWPPSSLFTFTYGWVALRHWGVDEYKEGLETMHYSTATQAGRDAAEGTEPVNDDTRQKRAGQRERPEVSGTRGRRSRNDETDKAMAAFCEFQMDVMNMLQGPERVAAAQAEARAREREEKEQSAARASEWLQRSME